MKLLIITQRVDKNDGVLGFFHNWITEFAKHCEKLTVICLYKGEYDLPENVNVLSLGKETGINKFKYIYRFYKYIFKYRKDYDNVFVHMNQIYVILGWTVWKFFNKKMGFWYAHGGVSSSLKLASKLSNVIFTSTESGFRLKSDKLKIVGQGIDLNKFYPIKKTTINDNFNIITVGRISPVKNYGVVINALNLLKSKIRGLNLIIIGGPLLDSDKIYLEQLKKDTAELNLQGIVNFIGPIPNHQIVEYLHKADLMINPSVTGSLDKVMTEAMACGLPVLTCNISIKNILRNDWSKYYFDKNNHTELYEKIKYFYDNRNQDYSNLRDIVEKDHNIKNLIKRIYESYK